MPGEISAAPANSFIQLDAHPGAACELGFAAETHLADVGCEMVPHISPWAEGIMMWIDDFCFLSFVALRISLFLLLLALLVFRCIGASYWHRNQRYTHRWADGHRSGENLSQ